MGDGRGHRRGDAPRAARVRPGAARTLPARCTTTFVIDVTGTRFTLRASDPEAVAGLRARLASGATGVVLGRIVRGDGGFNAPWRWHLDPATVEVPDVAMELCDGQPGYVNEHVDEFVDTVRYYCPWNAKVVQEVR